MTTLTRTSPWRAWLRGAASAFDLRGVTYGHYPFLRTGVDETIRADFEEIGTDLRAAIASYEEGG